MRRPFHSNHLQHKLLRPSLALCFIFILFWLSGCGNPTPPPTPTPPPLAQELIFYDWDGDMSQAILDVFNQKYGVKVNYVVYEAQEEAMDNIRAGQVYDVVVMESRHVPTLVQQGLIAEIDYRNVPNYKNLAANFRDLAYDPENKHSIPYTWGTTGLIARSDLVAEPVTRWADLWDPRYAGRVGIWSGQPREVIAFTLKSLGYSANSEKPAELDAALVRLLELRPHVLFLEDIDLTNASKALLSGQVVLAEGYSPDLLMMKEKNKAITYVLPQEGALLWGDTFVIPANTPNKYTAEVFLNFLLSPEIGAKIVNDKYWATPNEAAKPFITPELLNNPAIFPPQEQMKNAETLLPLTPEGQKLYDQVWERFMSAPQEKP